MPFSGRMPRFAGTRLRVIRTMRAQKKPARSPGIAHDVLARLQYPPRTGSSIVKSSPLEASLSEDTPTTVIGGNVAIFLYRFDPHLAHLSDDHDCCCLPACGAVLTNSSTESGRARHYLCSTTRARHYMEITTHRGTSCIV